jgi:hypothetical protein
MMHKDGQTITIRHREFIGEVRSSTAYTVRYELPINPGLASTFPWLSDIAVNFQQYRVKGMVFHYIPTSGNAVSSTNNALGSVMIQTSYRTTESPPGSKVELLNEYWSTEVVPSESVAHPIECNPNENPFNVQYVRATTSVPTGDSLLMYDLGRTYVAVAGQQASDITLGDLWVTYEIELKKPVLESNVDSLNRYRAFRFAGSVTTSTYFAIPSGSSGNLDVTTDSQRTINLGLALRGEFDVVVTFFSTAGVTSPASSPSGDPTVTNCTIGTYAVGTPRIETIITGAGATVNRLTYAFNVRKSAGSVATILLPTSSIASGSLNVVNVNVTQIATS